LINKKIVYFWKLRGLFLYHDLFDSSFGHIIFFRIENPFDHEVINANSRLKAQ